MNTPIEPRPSAANDGKDPVDTVLARLLIADQVPDGDHDAGVDRLVEPPAVHEPIMSLERRRRLLAVVQEELMLRRRDVGFLPQVLFRYRDTKNESTDELAARVNDALATVDLSDLLAPAPGNSIGGAGDEGAHFKSIDSATIRRLETDDANLEDDHNQAVAAVLTAVHRIRPEAAREALLRSLEPPVDGPLAAARPKIQEATPEDQARIERFMAIYERVKTAITEGQES